MIGKQEVNKKYHFLYQTKNIITNMTYIGRHSTDNLNDGYLGSGTILKRAIKKYGKHNFEIIILNLKTILIMINIEKNTTLKIK